MASAQLQLQNRQYESAVLTMNKIRACAVLPQLELFKLGWMYGRARHFQEALQIFKSVPVNIPDRAIHAYSVALASFELTDYRSTTATLEAASSEQLLDADSANLLGVSYSKLGLYQKAEATLTSLIQTDTDNLQGYLNLVTLYADQDRFSEAAATALRAQAIFPDSPAVLIVSGAANMLTGKLDEAHNDFSRAALLSPGKADPRFFLALTEYKRGDFTRAVATLNEATQSGIADSDLHYLLAECLLKVDGSNKLPAMHELNKAVALNPDSVSARCLRGKLLLDAGRAVEAANDLERAHEKDPQSRTAAYNLARAYQRLGRSADAQTLFAHIRTGSSDSLSEMSSQRLNSALTNESSTP